MNRPEALLEDLCRLAALPPQAAEAVSIDGEDPILRTRLRVAETGAVAIAAAGMGAAWLWSLTHGERQHVHVEAAAAAAAMQSYKFMRVEGRPPGPVMDELTGSYRLKDGRFIYLHCNFPNLADRNCAVLGADKTPASIAARVAQWEGSALEEALHEGGGCGARVRDAAEWYALPQGRAARAAPLLEILRIGDAPVEPLARGTRPLAGVRVLDLTRVLAGPTCARNLSEHGADVLRVSRADLAASGVLDFDTGVGKRSTHLDLREAADMARMTTLVREGAVFSQAYRPGALARLGLGPEDVAALRPGIVYVTLNAWGFDGPWSERRGYDTVVQAANGLAWRGPELEPVFLPVAQQDYVAGYLMAFGAMAALARRATEGGSWHVRVSLAACGEWVRAQGLVDEDMVAGLPAQVPQDRVTPWLVETPSPVGPITQLGPVARLSLTPPRWDLPIPAPGVHPPTWNRQYNETTSC